MLHNGKKYWLLSLTFLLLIIVLFIFYLNLRNEERKLTVAFLDIGQGDAIFIESSTGTQVLIDTGPPRRVLDELKKVMPVFDRSLDAVVMTHPDNDHIGGLPEVLKTYKVGMLIEPGTLTDSEIYESSKEIAEKKKIQNLLARKGTILHLGDGAYLEILFPDRDVALWETNTASVVARLVYGETSVILTGDATIETENLLLKSGIDADVLKVGHHGSNTSTSPSFVEAVSPEYAVISVGKDNTYGHPSPKVLETLSSLGIKVFRTDESGTIIWKSDGINADFSFKN